MIEPRKLETELPKTLRSNVEKLRRMQGWKTDIFSPVHVSAQIRGSELTVDTFVVEERFRGFGYTSGVIIGVERFVGNSTELERAKMVVIPSQMERDETAAKIEFEKRGWVQVSHGRVLVTREANGDSQFDSLVEPGVRLTYEKQCSRE